MILKKCHLSIENSSIKVKYENSYNLVPSEDISIIIVDNIECTFTVPFFNECAQKGIAVMICGKKHTPIIQALPNNMHYRLYGVLEMQIKQPEYFKDMVAEQLLRSKLINQQNVLKLIKANPDSIDLFDDYIKEIDGRDYINREGTAAKVFFNALYSKEYTRFETDPINITQNYGYAILSASISRHLCALGFNLCIGVNHEGQNNPYNLSYDFIEPYRALVDYYIYSNKAQLTDDLSIQTKKELVNLLNIKVKVRDKIVSVQYSIELLTKSYLRMLEFGEDSLDLPEVIETNFLKENEYI